jgi:hypothetical protein
MKVTLRELFLLTLIVALAVGWSVDRTQVYWQFCTYKNLSAALEQELRERSPATHIEIHVSPGRRETHRETRR